METRISMKDETNAHMNTTTKWKKRKKKSTELCLTVFAPAI